MLRYLAMMHVSICKELRPWAIFRAWNWKQEVGMTPGRLVWSISFTGRELSKNTDGVSIEVKTESFFGLCHPGPVVTKM